MAEEVGRIPYLDGKAPAYLQRTAPGRVRGYTIIEGPLLPGQEREGETRMCVHCQAHFHIVPGSGTSRGFCQNCDGVTCGKEKCETHCIPFEMALEIAEGRDPSKTFF